MRKFLASAVLATLLALAAPHANAGVARVGARSVKASAKVSAKVIKAVSKVAWKVAY
jgi:hypothetical protein